MKTDKYHYSIAYLITDWQLQIKLAHLKTLVNLAMAFMMVQIWEWGKSLVNLADNIMRVQILDIMRGTVKKILG